MINIPYGESDFYKVIAGEHFYQDRTNFIEKLEAWSNDFPVFLRPRRFGKSLFVSMLHHYYGLEHKANFQTLFGNLYVGENPTIRANSYLVLSFEFSRIDTASQESTYQGFLKNTISGARRFFSAYPQFYSDEQKRSIEVEKTPEAVVNAIFDFTVQNKIPHKIYLGSVKK
jgi:Predicted AAA-ATPase